MVESLLPKQVVRGSNPLARSNIFNHFRLLLLRSPFAYHGFCHGSVSNRRGCDRWVAESSHCYHRRMKVVRGEMNVSSHEGVGAMPEERRYSGLGLATHGLSVRRRYGEACASSRGYHPDWQR